MTLLFLDGNGCMSVLCVRLSVQYAIEADGVLQSLAAFEVALTFRLFYSSSLSIIIKRHDNVPLAQLTALVSRQMPPRAVRRNETVLIMLPLTRVPLPAALNRRAL